MLATQLLQTDKTTQGRYSQHRDRICFYEIETLCVIVLRECLRITGIMLRYKIFIILY